ncbi:MAG: HD domain-containing protein [Pontiellaceae bacterium]|nr:HD domain-containing protein [Pontiellaceae bacterium]
MAEQKISAKLETSYSLKAVIDVGSTSIRMTVAQVYSDGTIETLDALHQNVSIGSDTFTEGRISRQTIEDSVKVLRSFSALLEEYRIDLRTGVRAVATSAVREACNRTEFLDRVYMATDISVEVIEGFEVNRLTFLGVRPYIGSALQRNRLLVVEVGGGSTELLGLNEGRVFIAHTYRMGSHRMREVMDAQSGSELQQQEVLSAEIDSGVRQCRDTVGSVDRKISMLLLGGEVRFAARLLDKTWDETQLLSIKVSALARLANHILALDVETVARQYHLSFEEAQTVGTALCINVRLARAFRLQRVYVSGVTLRDGLLEEMAQGNVWADDFVNQILHSVREVGRKYQVDQKHSDCVADIARALFRALQTEHRLDYRYEVILMVAAQLHDIGSFIGSSSHHKHSKYLIEHSDIFGLGEKDVRLSALVARYHRRAVPKPGHSDYAALTRDDRLVVNKLAAILRVADALDRTHTQLLQKIIVTPAERQVLIDTRCGGDFAAEKRALIEKGEMFEQVYGRPVVLRTRKKQG